MTILALILLFNISGKPDENSLSQRFVDISVIITLASIVLIVIMMSLFSPTHQYFTLFFVVGIVSTAVAIPVRGLIQFVVYAVGLSLMVYLKSTLQPDIRLVVMFFNNCSIAIFSWILSRIIYREEVIRFIKMGVLVNNNKMLEDRYQQQSVRMTAVNSENNQLRHSLKLRNEEIEFLRKQIERETHQRQSINNWLEKQQHEVTSLIETIPDAIAYLDHTGKLIIFNKNFETIIRNLGAALIIPGAQVTRGLTRENHLKLDAVFEILRQGNEFHEIIDFKDHNENTISLMVDAFSQKGPADEVISGMTLVLRKNPVTEKVLQRNQVLLDITSAANSAVSLDELCKKTHEFIMEILPAKNFYISVYNELRDALNFPYYVDDVFTEGRTGRNEYWKPSRGITEYMFQKNRAQLFNTEDLEKLISQAEIEAHGPIPKYWMGTPLIDIRHQTIGIMATQLYDNNDEQFTAVDLDILKQIALPVGMAIDRIRSTEAYKLLVEHIDEGILIRQKEKMDSIGIMAGGMAHEINNPLTGMINYAQLIKDSSENTETIEYANNIVIQGERVSEIIQNMLAFSRLENDKYYPLDPVQMVESSVILVRSLLLKDFIDIETGFAENLPQIMGHLQQLQQVIINLLLNARDALNAKYHSKNPEKLIHIQVTYLLEKEMVAIVIRDQGTGIPENIRSKIFDPFFTTKEYNKETGLGLSVAYGVITDHGGVIEVDSREGSYAEFSIFLPILQ